MKRSRLFPPLAALWILACATSHADPSQAAALSEAMQTFTKANLASDIPAMEAALADIRKLDPEGERSSLPELQLALAKKDWTTVSTQLDALIEGPMSMLPIQTVARALANGDDAPKELYAKSVEALQPWAQKLGSPTDYQTLATLQWKAGDKEQAVTSAKSAATAARGERYVAAGYPAAAYDKLAAALEAGEMPTRETINRWFGEESAKLLEQRPKP